MSIINIFRCNKCYLAKTSTSKNFLLTQCGHIFCHQCAATGGSTCLRCQTPDIQTMELNELPPTIDYLFTPLHEFLENMTKAGSFQFGQTSILKKCFQEQEEKYTLLKRAYWENRKIIFQVQQRKEKLKNAIQPMLAAKQNYHPQVINSSATADRRYIESDNFFRQENPAKNNFSHVNQNQRSDYPFGRKVAFVNPNNPYDSDHASSTFTSSTKTRTPMSIPETPSTVTCNYRRIQGSSTDSSINGRNYRANNFI